MSRPQENDTLLAEQIAYYRAIAPEYEDHAIPGPGANEQIERESSSAELEARLRRLRWDVTVTATSGPCYRGAGHAWPTEMP